jgi:deazaflavin-dependent oxidoreductase (nitroreductase family)
VEVVEMMRMMRRAIALGGLAGAVALVVRWRRARAAALDPFPAARRFMNERIDPWLLRLGLVGGRHSEIGLIEHVGRRTGMLRLTPVHPTVTPDEVWIPLPYGETSAWAQNVLAAGRCRLQIHETLYELDRPAIVDATEDPELPWLAAWLADRMAVRYLRLHRVVDVPGAFATHSTVTAPPEGSLPLEPPLDVAFELPAAAAGALEREPALA